MLTNPAFKHIAGSLLQAMLLAREGDRREAILVRQSRGWFHVSCAGHEALAALALLLTPADYVFPYYRDKAIAHACGLDSLEMARLFFARPTSLSAGRNMPSHFSSKTHRLFPVTTPTGAQCLPAVGMAWQMRMENTGGVVLCTIGDAATRQGEFYEAVSLAVQERLPIVFVVEDNHYGISTPTEKFTPIHLGLFSSALVKHVDGRDAEAVYTQGAGLITAARTGQGPFILWCDIDRLDPHTSTDDHRLYRDADEISTMQSRDPIALLMTKLIQTDVLTESELQSMRDDVKAEVANTYQQAEDEEISVDDDDILTHLYDLPAPTSPVPKPHFENTEWTMVEAVNDILRSSLDLDRRVLLFGEDIEDPKGGVFGLTRGLSSRHPGRVINSPLAEATLVGAAVGLAAAGLRPIIEIQFIDFIGTAFNQLISQITNLRWRSTGEWTCPIVMYAPYGAYVPAGGMWHSQSNESWFAHMPGLRVAIPSTPEDAAGFFWSALQGSDPSLILLPKHLLRRKTSTQLAGVPVPFGSAMVRRAGTDVTLVSWGNCVELCETTAAWLEDDGVSAEVIDLRSLVPCDWETVAQSVAKTGSLVVVQEDTKTCGFGQAVISEITTNPDYFYTLSGAPQLVSRPDVHVPFSPFQEAAILPDVKAILHAVKNSMK